MLHVKATPPGAHTPNGVLARHLTGEGVVMPFDPERARRKLARYLGPDETRWDGRFSVRNLTEPEQSTRFVASAPRPSDGD